MGAAQHSHRTTFPTNLTMRHTGYRLILSKEEDGATTFSNKPSFNAFLEPHQDKTLVLLVSFKARSLGFVGSLGRISNHWSAIDDWALELIHKRGVTLHLLFRLGVNPSSDISFVCTFFNINASKVKCAFQMAVSSYLFLQLSSWLIPPLPHIPANNEPPMPRVQCMSPQSFS